MSGDAVAERAAAAVDVPVLTERAGAEPGGVAILGATSAVGQATARQLAAAGRRPLLLIARDAERLETVRRDLLARSGAPGDAIVGRVIDLDDLSAHEALVSDAPAAIDDWYLFYARFPDQAEAEAHWSVTARVLHTNFISAASLLSHVATRAEARGRGRIVVISSVAGDRARQSNYVYGTSKGALSLFCQGLRNRLARHGVQVTTVKPGFIDTPMTRDVPKRPAVLWAEPDRVASDLLRAVERGRDVAYTPWFWRYIMWIIRAIPERVFKRLTL